MGQIQNMRAGGTINVALFVTADPASPNSCIQASNGTVVPIGISSNASRANPDPSMSDATALVAALVNENIEIHGEGSTEVDLTCAFAWSPGDLLMSDGDGKGILATAGSYYGAQAASAGQVGALCPVRVTVGLAHA